MDVLGSVLVIAPHPDDETFGCGGTIAMMVRMNAMLSVLFVTDGCASHPNHPTLSPSEIASRRKDEARNATGILGIEWERVTSLDVRDGTVAHLGADQLAELESEIVRAVKHVAPNAILMPCRRDGSSEHDAAYSLVSRALEKSGIRIRTMEFPVWSWWNPLLLLPMFSCRRVWRVDISSVRDLKQRAASSYASQLLPIPPETNPVLPPGFASMFLTREEYLFEW